MADRTARESGLPGLRLELFVRDLERSSEFYVGTLGYAVARRTDDYVSLVRDGVALGLGLASHLPPEHPLKPGPGERTGVGVEIVLMVEDVAAAFAQAELAGAHFHRGLTVRPWGLTDFRLLDPDGYYLRVTGLSKP